MENRIAALEAEVDRLTRNLAASRAAHAELQTALRDVVRSFVGQDEREGYWHVLRGEARHQTTH